MKHPYLVGSVVLSALLFSASVRAQSTFPDVPDNHWAAAAVKKLAEAGIVEGFANEGASRVASDDGISPSFVLNVPRIKTALVNSAGLAGTSIDVEAWMPVNATRSVVALRGTVKNAAQKKLAESIAKKSAPDARIINHLKVVAPKATKAKAKPQKTLKRAT